jgi:hypothetical protein
MRHLRRVLGVAVAAVLLGVVPVRANGQNSAPCPSENSFTRASDEIGNTATTAASTGTTVAAAEAKLKGIFATKPKPATTPTTTTAAAKAPNTAAAAKAPTTVAAAKPPAAPAAPAGSPTAAAAAAKPATGAPCGGAKGGAGSPTTVASSTPAGAPPAAAGQKPAAAAAGTEATAPGVTTISGIPAFTKMPDGEYMLAYDSPDPAHKKTYAKVKKVSEGTEAGHPSDGVYTDDKNFYVVTGGQMVLTPASGAPGH